MARKRIVVTGAAGMIGQRMLPELQQRYDTVLLDIAERTGDGMEVPGLIRCDLSDPDRGTYREHFRGADAVVHLGWARLPGMTWENNTDDTFRTEHANVAMAYNVYRACQEAGVPRVIVASSNHATDFYERLLWRHDFPMVTPQLYPLSDNYYGWSKAAYEELGFVFATGQVDGHALEVIQVRIGAPRENILDTCRPGEIRKMNRGLGMYLSRRDQVQLFVRCVETADIADEHGVPFLVVYGVSGNSHNYWDLTNARRVLGYVPEDDSQVLFARRIAEIAGTADPELDAAWDGRTQP